MTEEGLKNYQAYIGKECLYIERPVILTTKVLAVELQDTNIAVTLLTTHPRIFRYRSSRIRDDGFPGDWQPARQQPDQEWEISMPRDHVFISSQYKLYFGSTFEMGMRLYFIPEFIARFKEGDFGWWDDLETYNRAQPV